MSAKVIFKKDMQVHCYMNDEQYDDVKVTLWEDGDVRLGNAELDVIIGLDQLTEICLRMNSAMEMNLRLKILSLQEQRDG